MEGEKAGGKGQLSYLQEVFGSWLTSGSQRTRRGKTLHYLEEMWVLPFSKRTGNSSLVHGKPRLETECFLISLLLCLLQASAGLQDHRYCSCR